VRTAFVVTQLLVILGLLVVHCEAQSKPETIVPQPNPQASLTKTPEEKSPGSSDFQERNPHYQLRPDDIFDVVFEFSPEFNQTITVQPDGYISLRGVGELQVKGLTIPQLTSALRKAYGEFLHEPAIQIVLKDFEKPYFVASGHVARPGKYDLRGDTTVSQAIAVAGGFLDTAKHSQVLLFRRVSEGWVEAKVLDVKKMMNTRNLAEDAHLRPGDMIFVPQNRLSKIERFLPIPRNGNVMVNPAQY
jgi:polysaccharide export outer membrane protein